MAIVYSFIRKNTKAIVITASVLLLNVLFGFDPKFTIINIIWLLPFKTYQ